ncbi:uncharacterized protein LOC144656632 isoform X1 [Oculina patagonica]
MSAKDTADGCSGLLEKLHAFLPHDKILVGVNNFQKPLKLLASIDGLGKGPRFFKSIQSYVKQSILKPLSDCQDKFIILVHQDDAFSKLNVLSTLCALAYDMGDKVCLEEIADQYQHYVGVGHQVNNLGVMFTERMDYKRSETCFVSAKRCFEYEHDNLGNAVATLNLAILYKLLGDYQSACSCCDGAASLCHDVSMRTTNDVGLLWKLLTRVAGLCQEFGNYKRYQDILQLGVFYDIGSVSEASQVNLTKQLMTLQLQEQCGEKIKGEELEDYASCLFLLMDQSSTEKLSKPELINADFITIVMTVAKMYRDIDHLEEACKLLEKLEATFLLVHGRKHSLYGSLLYQIGSFKLGAGNAAEAFKTLQQAEAIFVHNFGKGHHIVASCKSLLGTCALVKGQTKEASTHLTEALVLFKKMNHHHPEVAEIFLKLALLSSEEGNFQSAKITVQEAVNIFISACGDVSLKTGSAYFQAAVILQKAGESRAAVDKVRKAIDIFLQLGLRCDHPDVKTCRSLLGALQLSLGEVDEAEEQFTEVQQQVPLQDEPCLTAKVIAPENTNMFFQAKTGCGTGTCRYMGPCLGAQVVSLVNLVRMKMGQERRNHLNTLLSCLQGHDTGEPIVLDFAGQSVCYISHQLWTSGRCVYCIATSAPPPDCFQTDHSMNADYTSLESESSKHPNVFLLSPSNGYGRRPCSILLLTFPEGLEMKELSISALCESVKMLFLKPKFKEVSNTEGQDFYMELTLPKDPFASFSLSAQIDLLPLLVKLKLSDLHKESGDIDSVAHASLTSVVKPSAHVSYFSYRLSSQPQAELVFGSLIFSLGQSLALAKVEGIEVFNGSAVDDGEFFLFLEPSNSSISVVVEKESVLVKCRTVNEFESPCICSLVKNILDCTMESLCHVVRVALEASMQLPCDNVGSDCMKESANCSCGCRDFQSESCSGHSLETLNLRAHKRSQELESYHLEGNPSGVELQNENEEDIPFYGHPDDKISTEVCVSLLECLLSNRHVSSERQQSGTGEMSSTDASCLDGSMQLKSSLLSPGSTTSLNSLPTSPSNAAYEMPVFLQNMSPSLEKVEAESWDETDDSSTGHSSENSSTSCVGCNESSLNSQEKLSNSTFRVNLLQDSSGYGEGLPSKESFNDVETTLTMQFKDGTGLSKDETRVLKSEGEYFQSQCYELKQQIIELEEQLQQCEAEKQQLELELGRKSFFEDKQKRSEKALLSSRTHVSEQSKSFTASGASCAFTSMEGKLLGGGSLQQETGFSLQGRLLEISNSLSEVELEQMKFLARPKIGCVRLARIREGFELFEELTCTYVRELLIGIQRFDLLEKLDLPSHDKEESGHRQDGEVNEDNNGLQEEHFTAALPGGECSANDKMVLSTADSTQDSSGDSQFTNRSTEGSGSIRRREDHSSSSDESEVVEANSPTRNSSASLSMWERSGARPKDRASMQSAPGKWLLTEKVQQDPAGVDDILARRHCQGIIENNESMPVGAEASRVADSTSTPVSVCWWERSGARPKDRARLQGVPIESSQAEQVRQEPPGVYEVSARHQCEGGTEDDEPMLQRTAASRVADSTSTVLCTSLVVHSTSHGDTEQLDTRTDSSYDEDEECLPVPPHSATLPTGVNDCISESLETTNNSRLATREGMEQPNVVQGIARALAQQQREREEQDRRLRAMCPHSGLIPRL